MKRELMCLRDFVILLGPRYCLKNLSLVLRQHHRFSTNPANTEHVYGICTMLDQR